jgi:hypothetical protein
MNKKMILGLALAVVLTSGALFSANADPLGDYGRPDAAWHSDTPSGQVPLPWPRTYPGEG